MSQYSPPLLLAEDAYRQIKTLIISGSIDPQTPIREAELARQLGVSRTPIREALKRLHAEKLLELSPSGGYLVVQFTASDLQEIYAVRAVLEGLAASLAAQKMTRMAIASLEDQLEAMASAVESKNDGDLAALNSKFHSVIAETSGNKFLQSMLLSIQDIFERYRLPALSNDQRRLASYLEHRQIADALIKRDATLAEARIKSHIEQALALRREVLSADG